MNQAKPPNGEVSTGISVLLIEDDLVDEMALTKAVTEAKLPYKLTVARSVAEARATLSSHRFDIILADFDLPDGTAFDLLNSFVGQLVIFTTGAGDEEVAARALAMGVSDYLIKDPQRGYLKLLPWRVEAALNKSRIERQFRDSEELFRKFFHASGSGRAIVGIDGRFLRVNQALCEIVGYSEKELLEKTYQDITYPGDAAADLATVEALIAGTINSFRKEKRYFHRNGQVVWINLAGSLERNADGTPRHFVAQIQDITERKKLEESLRETQINLAEAQRIARIGSWSWNVEIDTISWSDELRRIYDLEQVAPPLTYAEHLKLYTSESASQLNAAVEKARKTGEPYELDLERISTGGRKQWIQARGEAIRNANGQIVGLRGTAQDITERKHAEAALQASEAKFRAIINVSPVPMALNDEEKRITFLNPAFVQTFGYDQFDIPTLGEWWPEAYPDPDYRQWVGETWQARLDQANQTGTAFAPVELRVRCKDGTYRIVSGHAAALGNSFKGTHLVLLHDITERKRAGEALAQFQHTLDQTLDSVFMFRAADFRFIYVNAGAKQQVGYTEAELLGMSPLDIKPEFTRDTFQQMVQPLIDGSQPSLSFQAIHRHKDGRDFPVEVFLQFVRKEPQEPRFVAIVRDITARRLAEAELRKSQGLLRSIIDSTPSHIFSFDLEHRFTIANRMMAQYFGLTTQEVVGKTLHEVFPHDVAEALLAVNRKIIATGEAVAIEESVPDHTGKMAIMTTLKFPVRDAEGKIVGLGGVATDTTAEKNIQQTLNASLLEKTALLKEVHHRVKNNLQVINSLLRLESRRSAGSDTKAVLIGMQGRIRAMALLHESLYQTGTFAVVDLGAYLRQIATEFFRTLVATPGAIQLRLELSPISVVMDQAAPCGLLVGELISNCLKHGFPNDRTGEIHIELQTVADGPQCCLRVSDTGVGLPADFETRRKHSLGLELACGLAEQLGGELKIGPGPAAVFAVTFTPSKAKLPPNLA